MTDLSFTSVLSKVFVKIKSPQFMVTLGKIFFVIEIPVNIFDPIKWQEIMFEGND